MNFSEYKNKRVFLTGHTGFKGSWLLAWLHQLGAEVKGYSLPPDTQQSLFTQMRGSELGDSILADILNKEQLEREIISFEPDFIFHLAAQPLVRLSYDIPVETFEVNAIGTANVLNAVRGIKKNCVVVCITTDKVYENKEWHYPYRESDSLGGYDPYSASKACAELIISSYRSSYFNPAAYSSHLKAIASARAGNVIGGGDWAKDRIIPDIVNALKNGKAIPVRNPKSVRPWQHVLEPLAGYLLLGLKMYENPVKFAGAWNFGPFNEDNLTVEELVRLAIETWGTGRMEKIQTTNAPHEAGLLKLDINKTVNELGWKPRMNASEAIATTIDWYRNADTSPVISLVKNDIVNYNQTKVALL
ncbi:MAG TPA: CDP-glucose 4,6-dehydratase [Flavisolibacter sp.]|nr:CDP-glucose 4,6-dehydratase [Flavisolibacter sp.]